MESVKNNPLVSIIIPAYNYGHLIAVTLSSVTQQTYKNWECIIIDDGSTDDSKEVIAKIIKEDSRFTYVYQRNGGLSSARNNGLRTATGKYVQFLDADDLLEHRKIELHVQYLEQNEQIDLVYSDVWVFINGTNPFTDAQKFKLSTPPVSGSGEIIVENLMEDNFFLVHCPLFRREILSDKVFFNEQLRALEDWHFWYRLALDGVNFQYIQNDLCRCYVRSHGANMSADRKRMWGARIMARADIVSIEKTLVQNKRFDKLSPAFFQKSIRVHKAIMSRDRSRYELYFGNVWSGIKFAWAHAWHSRRPYFALYDGAYWIKERLKGRG